MKLDIFFTTSNKVYSLHNLFRFEIFLPKAWIVGAKNSWNNITNGLIFAVLGGPVTSNRQKKHEKEETKTNF